MSSDQINTIILIPVYNGRDSLVKLAKSIGLITQLPIMVVDDGSNDGLNAKDIAGVYLRHENNQGKGAALKLGLNHAKELGYTHAITLDADGQHDPTLIDSFYAHSVSKPGALVIGARDFANAQMPFHRKLSNNITSLILSLRSGNIVYDGQVGYRCYPLNDSRLWAIHEDGFQFESAVYFNAAKLKLKLVWQTIPVIYGNEQSHMHLVKDTLRFVRTFFRSFK